MVETPVFLTDNLCVPRHQRLDPVGYIGGARCRILDLVERVGETPEVVDERDGCGRAERGRSLLVMRRNRQDGAGFGQGRRPGTPGGTALLIDGVGGGTVADESGGEAHGTINQ